MVGSDTIVRYLRKARSDDSIKAIVLRVDSPGGSAIASDVIWREVELTRGVKPVIASMSDVAASGGYYIAMPAHKIVAEPATLTGSIGVVMVKFVIDGTLKKLGHEHGRGEPGALRRPLLADPAVLAGGARRRSRNRCRRPTTRSSRRPRPDGTPRRRRSTPSRRAGSGPASRRSRSAWSTSSAASIARWRSPRNRRKIGRDTEVELVVYPPKRSLYESLANPFGTSERSALLSAFLGLGDRRALHTLTAPLRVFRRGEPLAIMPNVFVH